VIDIGSNSGVILRSKCKSWIDFLFFLFSYILNSQNIFIHACAVGLCSKTVVENSNMILLKINPEYHYSLLHQNLLLVNLLVFSNVYPLFNTDFKQYTLYLIP